MLVYWDSETAFERWTETDDFEAALDELLETIVLDPDCVERYQSATSIEAP